jgi:hypothetical protein
MVTPSDLEYRNKFTFNQRGGSIEINNSTEREEVKISQFSGSNITLNNVVNSELATNNKQTKVLFDEFKTVGNTSNEFVGTDRTVRVAENNYEIKGIGSQAEIDALAKWKEAYRPIAANNSQFWITRGGESYPYPSTGRIQTALDGTRATNPDLFQVRSELNNTFAGYSKVPEVTSSVDEVASFVTVIGKDDANEVVDVSPSADDISVAFGSGGSRAPGVILFGAQASSATQDGSWSVNSNKTNLTEDIINIQDQLSSLEQNFGNGGDEIEYIKRNKVQVVGGVLNDYAAVRIDKYGRSQPTEVGVSPRGVFNHNDYVPHVEEVDNSSNFPGGNYNLTVNNKYNLIVGSGGAQIKTSGGLTLGGSIVKIGAAKVNISGSEGIVLGSAEHIDIFSPKIQFRSNRQIYANGSFGVLNNVIIGGGTIIDGELYVNHITAPTEVQETMQTTVYGELVPDQIIGYVVGGVVYSTATPNTIKTYSHSHHFNNIPLRLTAGNNDMRRLASEEGINNPQTPVSALSQSHERK